MIEGMIQEVERENAAAPLNWVCKQSGKEVAPDAAPTITILAVNGDELVAATSMTAVGISTTGGRGFLPYDTETVAFTVGEIVTDGTSGAFGTVERVEMSSGVAGTLWLSNIWGTFGNNNVLTGSETGIAAVNSTTGGYSAEYTYALDASGTTTYSLAENYGAKITYIISTVTYHDWFYFDVVYHAFTEPIITTQYVDAMHPDWKQWHPDGDNALWTEQIKHAHMMLSKKIRSLGNRPAFLVKREELFDIELAFVEAEIAKRLTQMPDTKRDFWINNAQTTWNGRGEFAYDTSQEDSEISEDIKVMGSSITR